MLLSNHFFLKWSQPNSLNIWNSVSGSFIMWLMAYFKNSNLNIFSVYPKAMSKEINELQT